MDSYKAHCLRCGYNWIKKSTSDPKVCPACNSRKWKEAQGTARTARKIKQVKRDSRDLIIIPELFEDSARGDPDIFMMVCPVCGDSYVSLHGTVDANPEECYCKNAGKILNFDGECGHSFGLFFGSHKGGTLCKIIAVSSEQEV